MRSPDPVASKLKVFVSYSRSDIEFADQLCAALIAYGIMPSIDREGIHGAEKWQERLGQLILEADTVVFILTPASAASDICKWEVDEAVRLNKRVVPVIWRRLGEAKPHDHLRGLNYIYFYEEPSVTGSGFGTGLMRLIDTLTTDFAWIREHSRLGEQAARWERDGCPTDALPRGVELARLREWREGRPANAPELTGLQREFLRAAEEAEVDRNNAERLQLEEMRAAQKAREKALLTIGTAQRRNRYYVGLALLLAVLFFTGAVWQSRETERREALVMTSAADKAIQAGNYERAMRIAVQGLPKVGGLPFFSLDWTASEIRGLEAKLGGAAQASALRVVFPGDTHRLENASFSPDGTRVLAAYNDHTVRVWDSKSGELLHALVGDTARFSMDGTRILSVSGEILPDDILSESSDWSVLGKRFIHNAVQVWDAKSGDLLFTFQSTFPLLKVRISPDGSRIVTNTMDQQLVWDTYSGKTLFVLEGDAVIFSLDALRILAISTDEVAQILDGQTGRALVTLQTNIGWVENAGFSADGERVYAGIGGDTVRVWEVDSGRVLVTAQGRRASISLDGSRIVAEKNVGEMVTAWDVESGKELFTLQGSNPSFTPDGSRIVTVKSADDVVQVWDASNGQALFAIQGRLASFSQDGTQVVTISRDGTMQMSDLKTGQVLLTLSTRADYFHNVSFSPDGMHILAAADDNTARLWDANSGQALITFQGNMASFNRDGSRIFTSFNDNTARVSDAKTGQVLLRLEGHSDWISSASFSPNYLHIVTASNDHTARIWDAGNGQALLHLLGHTDAVFSASFSSDGARIVTASADKTARVWDAKDGKSLFTLEGHSGIVRDAAFSPDGARILTVSDDKTIRIWSANKGESLSVLRGHERSIYKGEYSYDGKRIVTSSADQTTRVWDADSGALLLTLPAFVHLSRYASFSSDGTRIIAPSNRGARVWDAESGQALLTLGGNDREVTNASFSPDGTRIVTDDLGNLTQVWDAKWLLNIRGSELVRRACAERLPGSTKLFTAADTDDPILSGLAGANPCERRGPLALRYWTRFIGLN